MLRTFLLPSLWLVTALPAQDDRDRDTPTAAVWFTGQSTTDLQNLSAAGWRFTDLDIQSTSPFSFTVAAVRNTGPYYKGWIYLIGVTAAQLTTSLNQNNARLVDLEPYDSSGTTRFCAIAIANTGADAKAWWWYYNQTSAQVNSTLTANNGRLVCFRRYTAGGQDRFATVMIANTGADFRVWGYLYGANAATINQNIAQHGNRIYGITRIASDSYDVILVRNAGFAHWYYFGLSAAAVTELLQQNLGRIVDIERYPLVPFGARYDVAMIDNANPLERAARQQFLGAPASALGKYGFFLKEVNGPVLAEMRADTTFEPASVMKTVYHVHAMRRVALGQASLNQTVNKPSSCGVPGTNQTLQLTLRQMMENSDNMATLAVSNLFGIPNIQNTATLLGMSSTSINFTIGCSGPDPESTLTLRDLSTLHERVANGYLGAQRATFYDLMAEDLSFPTWGTASLSNRIDAEAQQLGMPSSVRNAFRNALHIAYKDGGVGWTTPGPWTYYFAEGGWMSVPFKNQAGVITRREYTFSAFNYLFTGQSNQIPGRNAMCDAELELVWDRVRAALRTWNNQVPGQLTTLPGAGCPGSNGTPLHQATGTPETGAFAFYSLANAPANTFAMAVFGFDNANWNGMRLPVDLAAVGAPNCLVRINATTFVLTVTSSTGSSLVSFWFPNNPALVGALLYSQFAVHDPPANTFGWTVSNAIRTTLGGWL